jgi:hypothetical protein
MPDACLLSEAKNPVSPEAKPGLACGKTGFFGLAGLGLRRTWLEKNLSPFRPPLPGRRRASCAGEVSKLTTRFPKKSFARKELA